ncbi:MAG: FecR domain-containing protein [Betaproteobacteria bacterium]|nr:FecR domain-containing protein [Betaproteobacteria bacterium]
MKSGLSRSIAIVLFALAMPATAADVGRVLLAAGDTVAVRDKQIIKLVFRSTVQDKDVLRTGPASNLQVRFIDESILSMRENSEVRIDEFRFTGKEDGTERAFFSLLKGGLRKITGIIGRTNNKNYQMSSVVATIGIRGTDYATTLCQQDCYSNPSHKLAPDGQYTRVIGASFATDKLNFSTRIDQQIVVISQNAFAADANSRIQFLLEAPGFLNVPVKGKTTKPPAGKGDEQAETGGAKDDPRGTTAAAPSNVLPRLLTGASSTTDSVLDPVTAATGVASATAPSVAPTLGGVGAGVDGFGEASDGGAYLTPSMLTFNGVFTGLNIPAGTTEVDGSPIDPPGVSGAASGVAEFGSADPGDGSINARWVRWSSGTFTDDSGTSMLPGGFHGMVGNLTPPDVIAAKTGMVPFPIQVGGTTPTNNLGEMATSFGYPSLTVNFTTKVASLGMFSWTFPSNFWSFPSGAATVIITPGKGAGIDGFYGGGTCSGGVCSTSTPATLGVTGIFYGPRGDHLGAAFAGNAGSAAAMGVKLYTCAPSC